MGPVAEEFIKGLLRETKEKLFADLEVILYKAKDDSIFWSTLNETLDFEKTLVTKFDYHDTRLIRVFLDNRSFFDKWIELEIKFSRLHIAEAMKAPNAWERQFSSVPLESDTERVPKNTFVVCSTLNLIGERCGCIPSIERRLNFFQQVQLYLLVEYVDDLHLYEADDYKVLDSRKKLDGICSLLNAVKYCTSVLKTWSDEVMYVELWYEYQRDLNGKADMRVEEMRGGSIFDMQIKKCKVLGRKLRNRILEHIQSQFRGLIKMYIKKNFVLPPKSSTGVSVELTDGLVFLKEVLQTLSTVLHIDSFSKLWHHLLQYCNEYFLESLTLHRTFSYEGGLQNKHDISALMQVFRQVTSTPELIAKELVESSILLAKPDDDIRQLKRRITENDPTIATSLESEAIKALTPKQIKQCVDRRALT